ncbi:MAG: hypothetical protein CFE28_11060 [Alphaproteobacteria bacterium PA2]|nr:MAG: hypothetical protein CFE28_11060 [Alphaproteobacteria bacterium PA2]
MVAQVISLFQPSPPVSRDWTQQETAEFYRVESALIQAGVRLESDRGVSDEGDPWFIFCRVDNGDVFIHFARIDGQYVVDGVAFETPARGPDFAALVRRLISNYPIATARARNNSNIFVHPAALLIALVGAAFFQTSEAKAATSTPPDSKVEHRRSSLIVATAPQAAAGSTPPAQITLDVDANQAAAILLSAVLALHDDAAIVSRGSVTATPEAEGAFALRNWVMLSSQKMESFAGSSPSTPTGALDLSIVRLPESEKAAPLSVASTAADIFGRESSEVSLQAPSAPSTREVVALIQASSAPADPVDYSAAKPLFFLKVSSAPAPKIEAIAILSANAALAELVAKALPQVDRLPTSILDLISKGDHLDASVQGLAQQGPSEPANPQQDAPKTVTEPGASNSTETPPLESASAPATSALPVAPAPAVVQAPTVVAATAVKVHDAAINAAITAFMSHVEHLDMLLQGNQLVIYDRDILDPLAGRMELDSITITFEDGSSLSLVGTAADLSHFHWPG